MNRLATIKSRFGMLAVIFVVAVLGAVGLLRSQSIASDLHNVVALISSSCHSSSPCLQWTNTAKGTAIAGVALHGGDALSGLTTYVTYDRKKGVAGVIGVDATSDPLGQFNSGVTGDSTYGTGVTAYSANHVGLHAYSISGHGAEIESLQGNGVDGTTAAPSKTQGPGGVGVEGEDLSSDGGNGNFGGFFDSPNGTGVKGHSYSWVGAEVVGGGRDPSTGANVPALSIAMDGSPGIDLVDACLTKTPCDNAHAVFTLLDDGSAHFLNSGAGPVRITGNLEVDGTCTGCMVLSATTATGKHLAAYAPRVSVPTIDDVGESQLIHGTAYVAIDARFGSLVDHARNYLVFVTPEGDCNGLFIAQRTAAGFSVRELRGGTSSVGFSYRIVAKPVDTNASRLPSISDQKRPGSGSPMPSLKRPQSADGRQL